MPSLTNPFGLGAITAWLSGPSKSANNISGSSTKSKKPKTPRKMKTITISTDMIEGKTFEEAMAALMAVMPDSSTESEEADGLTDELASTSLSEDAAANADAVSHSHVQLESEGVPSTEKSTLETVNEAKPGCQCCDWAFQTELMFRTVMRDSQKLGPGSTEYYDAVAHIYHRSPSQVARAKFLRQVINDLQEEIWIGLDLEKEGGVKVMDYAAGTGILSQALAPHVTNILAIDKSRKMVDEYNKIVAKENNTKCEMKAVQGDMTTHLLSGKELGIEHPDGAVEGFDMVAMCLGVDFFTHESISADITHKQLMRSLIVMIDLINPNGILLIIDIEKWDLSHSKRNVALYSPTSPHGGMKLDGHGSKDIVKALEELGMEDIKVVEDQPFLFEVKHGSGPDAPRIRRKEVYFVVRARRGALFEKRAATEV